MKSVLSMHEEGRRDYLKVRELLPWRMRIGFLKAMGKKPRKKITWPSKLGVGRRVDNPTL